MLVPSRRSLRAQGEGEGTTMSATAIAEEEAGPRTKLSRLSFVFIWFEQPETKGRSLAEIQEMWERTADQAGKEA